MIEFIVIGFVLICVLWIMNPLIKDYWRGRKNWKERKSKVSQNKENDDND